MHCTAYHLGRYKTAELIEMPFGIMTRVGSRYHVLDGGPDSQGEEAILGET